MTRGAKIGTASVVALVVMFFACAGALPGPVIFLFYLPVAWFSYLRRVIPEMQVDRSAVISASICVVGVLIIGHFIARWLWRESVRDVTRQWRLRWTIAGVSIVLLMFTSGIAATGVAHQSWWLAKSDRPIYSRWPESRKRHACVINLESIGAVLKKYADMHGGALPESLDRLQEISGFSANDFVCAAKELEPRDKSASIEEISYVYLGAGLSLPVDPAIPIVCEPLSFHDGQGMNILFGDMSVKWIERDKAADVVTRAR